MIMGYAPRAVTVARRKAAFNSVSTDGTGFTGGQPAVYL
jgi:hypothetical protein